MEAKNLRIGNLVSSEPDSTTLDSIVEIENLIYNNPDIDGQLVLINGYNERELFGIEITKEILQDFGFVWRNSTKAYTFNKNGIEIAFDEDMGCYIEMVGIDINYVHELQNLFFAIHKQELELKPKEVSAEL